jgi:hypothetical protein
MKYTATQILIGILNPFLFLILLLRKLPLNWFFKLRMYLDGVDRPYYAYGLYQAALEARGLGISRISAYEFGVAGGHGLILLENLSEQITHLTGVKIDIFGFDLEVGLPTPLDYRDAPYIWKKGFYKMDVSALKNRLKNTKLVLGDVKKTIPDFISKDYAPVGFIAFDLDYYTSTKDAFKIFDADDSKILPRVFCYFDDIVGTDEEVMCEWVGELLAIKEFNDTHRDKKIAKINGMFHKRVVKSTWSDMIYAMHSFKHKKYNTYVYHSSDRQNILS